MSGRAAVDGRRPVDGRRGGWMDSAVCRSVDDPEVMFPDERDFVGIARALAVCAVCPVQRDCLAYACRLRVESGPLFGVWGWRLPGFFTFTAARRQLAVMS